MNRVSRSNTRNKTNVSKNKNTDKKYEGMKLTDIVNIKRKIGKGSFGEVYKAYHTTEKCLCALKVENKRKSKKRRLRSEYNMYVKFSKRQNSSIPREYLYLETDEMSYMIVQLLGRSLDDIIKSYKGKLDLGTCMKIAIMSIKCLEDVHSVGVIHRDIKPNNFMFGNKKTGEQNKLYIIDFGLSREYFKRETRSHIKMRHGRHLVGTIRYVSIRTHQGFEPSRRDDMESLGHMLIYMAKGRLPWQGLPKKEGISSADLIQEKKMTTKIEDLCEGLPECFGQYLEYTRNMDFKQRPDYEYLKGLFRQSAEDHDIDLMLDWEK